MATREQFVEAYLTLPGTTREMAEAVYDILDAPSDVAFMAALDDVCRRTGREGRDGE